MTWSAHFYVDGETPFEICSGVHRERAEFEADKFVARMTHPEVGVWWIEITEGEIW